MFQIRSLVSSQTDEWSAMVRRHETEEFQLKKAHIKEQFEVLKKLLLDAQKVQSSALKEHLEAESKELKVTQTKKSMDDTRVITQVSFSHQLLNKMFQDKNIKTKAERDRRVKEVNDKNLRLFVEGRRRLAVRYARW